MAEKKNLDQLTRSGLRSRLSRHRKKLQKLNDALRHGEVNDRTSKIKNKELRIINKNISVLQEEVAKVISYLKIE